MSRGGPISYVFEYFNAFIRFILLLNKLSLSGGRYDIIHIHNFPNFLIFSAVFQKIFGAKLILDIHDPMPELFRSIFCIDERKPIIRLLYKEEHLSTAFADHVIAANHDFRDIFIERGCPAEKITIIMNSPDDKFWTEYPSNFELFKKSTPFEILYIGTLVERYGIDIALKAIAKIKRENKIDNLRFSIIPKIKNESSYLHQLLKIIRELGLVNYIQILEPVPHHKMPEVIKTADLSVYTPLSDVHMNIALSLKIPKVVAVGKPLVTSKSPVLKRYFGEEALYMFEPGNVDECAKRIVDVFQKPNEAKQRVNLA